MENMLYNNNRRCGKIMENRLREIRRASDISQEKLAGAIYTTRQTIIAIEKGRVKRPSDELMVAIAKYFGMRVEEIFPTPLVQHVSRENAEYPYR
ncbi:hypothetical protein DCCM_0537 [Desulfocucumis palustris]|uniref:HTH cro/C1-type domain-containing protein n=2 Tax=Desulfocucumis palustris TaxID=1898651 RepID=A0A2L2X9R2_9FIRM|nr:hypothetical protein DCCM_0537 [Desulfocucumis palustris]